MTASGPVLRYLWLAAGFLSFGAGIAGVVLPLVPTTPFLILSAYCFARSSDRLHDWLVNHPRFGPPIRDWRDHRAISARGKRLSIVAMAAVLAISFAVGVKSWIIAIQVGVLIVMGLFILTRPSPPPDAGSQ